METVLELQRRKHEEIERLELAAAARLAQAAKSRADECQRDHAVRLAAERIAKLSADLLDLYDDRDGIRAEEVAGMTGADGEPFTAFYSRLAQMRQVYKDSPYEELRPMDVDVVLSLEADLRARTSVAVEGSEGKMQALAAQESEADEADEAAREMAEGGGDRAPGVSAAERERQRRLQMLVNVGKAAAAAAGFSDEEAWGDFLDLHACHDAFLNLDERIERCDYLQYLDRFDKLEAIPQDLKRRSGRYRPYVLQLAGYLEGFLRRAWPLKDIDSVLRSAAEAFEADWANGRFRDWSSDEQGVYCEACRKHFAKASVYQGHLSGKKHARAVERARGGAADANGDTAMAGGNDVAEAESPWKATAALEARVYALASLVEPLREPTKANVERKQARTLEELEEEAGAGAAVDVAEDEEEEEDGEAPIYNPKGLPLDWDGKPIPYWLYKLWGLSKEFRCEICGDASFKGPKNFAMHFKEWKHAQGMRALGIPNTHHFQFISRVKEAKELWRHIQEEKKAQSFVAGQDEEYEDSRGNVLDKKTYDLLAAQGLL